MYRKLTASHIFDGYKLLPDNSVLVTDTNGSITDIVAKEDAGDDIEVYEGLLSPGFINAHCHLELSHLKGIIPQKTGLVDFVQGVMSKRAAAAPSKSPPMEETFEQLLQSRLSAMIIAEQEMYNNGIVAVGDICNTAESIAVKEKSSIHWQNFVEVSGFIDAFAEKRFQDAQRTLEAFHESSMVNRQSAIAPHAPYSVSKTLFELINDETKDQLITIHNQECTAEDELYKNKSGKFLELFNNFGIDISGFKPTGKSSVQSYLPYFTNGQSMILVHNTFTTEEDIVFIKSSMVNGEWSIDNRQSAIGNHQNQTSDIIHPTSQIRHHTSDIFFCLCPNANQYIESAMPPIELLRKHNVNIVLGTDSLASNKQLDILEEIKTIHQQTNNAVPLEEMLQWATSNGAEALQVNNKLGSFEKGKQPGVVLISDLSNNSLSYKSKAKRII